MPTQDTSKIKEDIISILKNEGPNFPSPIASKIQTSILFTSAFLSELLSEKALKITNMKVGSSPIYYLQGQEEKLESFAIKHLKSKEKDAFILLKEKNFLKDKEQEPAIRVALRQIKDFAIPEEKNSELYWQYFLNKEEIKSPEEENESKKNSTEKLSEGNDPEKNTHDAEQKENKSQSAPPERTTENAVELEKEKPLNIFDNQKKETPKKKTVKKKTTRKKSSPKVNEKFFNRVKEYLSENRTEISDIVGFSRSDVTLKVKSNDEEYLLIAYNKRTIRDDDITKANKKAQELNLPFEIISLGEPTKKLSAFIEALRNLRKIKKINS